MASSWATSWGTSWGNSWGQVAGAASTLLNPESGGPGRRTTYVVDVNGTEYLVDTLAEARDLSRLTPGPTAIKKQTRSLNVVESVEIDQPKPRETIILPRTQSGIRRLV